MSFSVEHQIFGDTSELSAAHPRFYPLDLIAEHGMTIEVDVSL